MSFAVHQLPESPFQGIGVPQSPQQACFALKTLTVVDAGLQPLALVKVDAGLSDGYGNGCGHHHTLPEDADGSLKINDFVSYRGIENPYGRARQWLDGVNVYLLDVYVSNNPADWQQRTTEKYCWVGNLPPTHTFLDNGNPLAYHLFQRDLSPGIGLLPSSCEQASATTYLGDALETTKANPTPTEHWDGWSILDVGGMAWMGERNGIWNRSLASDTSNDWYVGGRLCYSPL